MKRIIFFVAMFVVLLSTSALAINYKEYWAIVDECNRPLPLAGYYFHGIGGNRGTMNDYDYTPAPGHIRYVWDGDSKYTAKAMTQGGGNWTWGGIFYSLIRDDRDNIPLNFNAIFGPYVKSEYQGKITGIEVVLSEATSPTSNAGLKLKVEAKNKIGQIVSPSPWFLNSLVSKTYPYTYTIDLSAVNLGEIEAINIVIDGIKTNDEVTLERVRLKVKSPDLAIQDEAFLWSYAWLMANYDPNTGMVQDRSNFQSGVMENVSATGKAAKVTAIAYKKGLVALIDAQAVVTKIADTLVNKVPRGPAGINTLWPHFAKNGGTAVQSNSEWASGDSVYAALDVIAALQLINDPQGQLPGLVYYLNHITWTALILPDKSISHGYYNNGVLINNGWAGFGMEAIGVNWAYASSTGKVAYMRAPPSDNGSGFNDNAHYPMCFSGLDYWGNNWDTYRSNMANTQIGWYTAANNNNLYADGLFGLSAAEVPEADDPTIPAGDKYKAYGVGGVVQPDDGNAEVIALHYGGMISDIRLDQAKHIWELLRSRGDISPLNNIESMRVDKSSGKKRINYYKGSWNLALQAEGWALSDYARRQELLAAVMGNAFLKKGYLLLKGYYTLHLGIQNDLDVFPKETQNQPYYSGAASALMALRFLDGSYDKIQSDIYNTFHKGASGVEMNESEISAAMNAEAPLVYNFSPLADSEQMMAVKRFIHWMDYQVIGAAAVPNVPVLVPTDGTYNWKVVRGFVSDRDPCDQGSLFSIPDAQVFGFWLNDPKSTGLGFDVYLTASEFLAVYSALGGKYICVAEPPAGADRGQLDNAIRTQKLRFAKGNQFQVARSLSESIASNAADNFQYSGRIKGFNWKGIVPQELKQDANFSGIFNNLHLSGILKAEDIDAASSYLLVLFADKPSSERVKVALMLDAKSGEFRQASWTSAGERFPKISRQSAVHRALRKLGSRYVLKDASFAWSKKFGISRFLPSHKLIFKTVRPSRLPKKDVTVFVHQDGSISCNIK